MNPEEPRQDPTPGIPTSILEYQRAEKAAGREGLHFRYDAVAVAALSSSEEVLQLRRRMAQAKETAKHFQDENARIAAERDVLQVKNAHATSVAGSALKAQNEAEKFAAQMRDANTKLQSELQAAQVALNTERARTVKSLLTTARLRAERDGLRAALNITDRTSALASTALEVASSAPAAQSPPPSPSVSSPSVSVTIPLASSPPALKRKRTPEPEPEPDPDIQIIPNPNPNPSPAPATVSASPPQAAASRRYRPHVTGSEPSPVLPKRPTAPALPTNSSHAPTASPPTPAPLKRKRTPDSEPDVQIILAPSSKPRSHPPSPSTSDELQLQLQPPLPPPLPTRSWFVQEQHPPHTQIQPPSQAQIPPPPQARTQPPPQAQIQRSPPQPPSKPKPLGLTHLPLLFETNSATGAMQCRTCRQAFAGSARWDELVGHVQGRHLEVCRGLEAMKPGEVAEQRQRLLAADAGKR